MRSVAPLWTTEACWETQHTLSPAPAVCQWNSRTGNFGSRPRTLKLTYAVKRGIKAYMKHVCARGCVGRAGPVALGHLLQTWRHKTALSALTVSLIDRVFNFGSVVGSLLAVAIFDAPSPHCSNESSNGWAPQMIYPSDLRHKRTARG
jgi:hypothetical protein